MISCGKPYKAIRQFAELMILLLACLLASELPGPLPVSAMSAPAAQSTDPGIPIPEQPSSEQSESANDSGTSKGRSTLSKIFGPDQQTPAGHSETWIETIAKVLARLALAALLAAMLAFRTHKYRRILRRNPYVAEAQILLAVVASALMMIVGDNAARAFGIFAAASLVRFRTNIRDTKEITILLVCLGIGLATGVGRLELAIILSIFVLLLLWLLEYYEPTQVFRSMELKIRTRDVDATQQSLNGLFRKYKFNSEVREINHEDPKDPLGKIVYLLNIHPGISTDRVNEEILAADPDHIDSIEWQQKKPSSYIYG